MTAPASPAPPSPAPLMSKTRLEAFSDGVIAIIITIMVLELKTPEGVDLAALYSVGHIFLLYALSFVYVGIYWNNHHHLLHAVHRINGGVLWANLHLLFWLSLVPFTTRWMGESHLATLPVAVYGLSLLMPSIAYYILVRVLIRINGHDSQIARAIGNDVKGMASTAIYLAGIALSFWNVWGGIAAYVLVALIWLVPDRRIEGHA
ncbi:TMEM175 family protein [Asticcacaulis sp. EMRT-3]|uniref:TMEM175 family protein n=1 Tax=Asticcacaulis sp. EMRT-3 TaxID=3040349 RepID=UPI0024AE8D74|nr:TMEM175 family protein [Asticcacaulis sp. EMRT-3]MDI7774861.1 TMEM175 family protein [Asticcacaulis sp. EMRT-3]